MVIDKNVILRDDDMFLDVISSVMEMDGGKMNAMIAFILFILLTIIQIKKM